MISLLAYWIPVAENALAGQGSIMTDSSPLHGSCNSVIGGAHAMGDIS